MMAHSHHANKTWCPLSKTYRMCCCIPETTVWSTTGLVSTATNTAIINGCQTCCYFQGREYLGQPDMSQEATGLVQSMKGMKLPAARSMAWLPTTGSDATFIPFNAWEKHNEQEKKAREEDEMQFRGLLLGNHTVIPHCFPHLFLNAFDRLFRQRAYLHWYQNDGLEIYDFYDARENMDFLVMDYHALMHQNSQV